MSFLVQFYKRRNNTKDLLGKDIKAFSSQKVCYFYKWDLILGVWGGFGRIFEILVI